MATAVKTKAQRKRVKHDNGSDAIYLPKHPSFDAYWYGDAGQGIRAHEKVVYWAARRVARKLHCGAEDVLGTAVLLFNRALYSHDPAKGKFSTYFCWGAFVLTERYWARYESQRRAVRYGHRVNLHKDDNPAVRGITEWLLNTLAWPEREKEDGPTFEELTASLAGRAERVIRLNFKGRLKVREVSAVLGVNKNTVCRIKRMALAKLRRELERS